MGLQGVKKGYKELKVVTSVSKGYMGLKRVTEVKEAFKDYKNNCVRKTQN